ncbi:hypothetical protein GQ457_03G011700 [Hibiscus cannabinus]
MGFAVSDELLGTVVPIVVYWIYSGIYMCLGSFDKYRLHSKTDEEEKNLVSKRTVVVGVLFQQFLQAAAAILLFTITGGQTEASPPQPSSFVILARQFLTAMLVMDTWQYFLHRYFHENKFLYRHLHSRHHRLVVPYAFGALYNHPLEGLLLDTVGGALSFMLSGMSPRTSILFFSFATIKTVDDHCGLMLPGNPSTSSFETILRTTMSTISFMAANTTSHNHSSSCGIKLWGRTCHIHLRREQKGDWKLGQLKSSKRIKIQLSVTRPNMYHLVNYTYDYYTMCLVVI